MLLAPSGHHDEPADPVLLGWIREQLDAILRIEPHVIVLLLGLLLLVIPAALLVLYVRRGRPLS